MKTVVSASWLRRGGNRIGGWRKSKDFRWFFFYVLARNETRRTDCCIDVSAKNTVANQAGDPVSSASRRPFHRVTYALKNRGRYFTLVAGKPAQTRLQLQKKTKTKRLSSNCLGILHLVQFEVEELAPISRKKILGNNKFLMEIIQSMARN